MLLCPRSSLSWSPPVPVLGAFRFFTSAPTGAWCCHHPSICCHMLSFGSSGPRPTLVVLLQVLSTSAKKWISRVNGGDDSCPIRHLVVGFHIQTFSNGIYDDAWNGLDHMSFHPSNVPSCPSCLSPCLHAHVLPVQRGRCAAGRLVYVLGWMISRASGAFLTC